jgi:hypothetical protein
LEPKVQASGEVTDAQSAALKVSGAVVSFVRNGGTVATATTDASGRYTVNIPKGEMKITVTKAGYITRSKTLSVVGTIYRGQGADLAMSKILPPGGWRVTLNWDKNPGDVDSHTWLGSNYNTHVYWPGRARVKTAAGTGGLKAVLDRDDVNGVGPETTTYSSVGNCRGAGKCLMKFQVKKYSGRGTLGEGHPIVTVYVGDRVEATYTLNPPANIGRNLYTVFTLWAGENPKVYQGEMVEGPYLASNTGVANWWGSLDSSQWSQVPWNALLTGLYRHPNGNNHVYAIEEGRYRRIKNNNAGTECYNSNWWGSLDREGWSTCNAGYYMAGLYRTGNMWDGSMGIHHIESALCCRPKGLPKAWGACTEDSMFANNGLSQCAAGKAMAGVWRSGDNSINGLDKMKCCELKTGLNAPR